MSSFMNKALAYLGLKDIEDDELYGDALEPTGQHRIERTVYPETQDTGSHPSHTATVRPITAADPRRPVGAVVRPITKAKTPAGRVHVVAPSQFRDAQEIGDVVKQGNPVIVNLQSSERDLSRRMIDFCSGLTYALDGQMEKVADQVFLLAPTDVEVPAEERLRLQERGLYRS
jgi:cell division inhibitor SepF